MSAINILVCVREIVCLSQNEKRLTFNCDKCVTLREIIKLVAGCRGEETLWLLGKETESKPTQRSLITTITTTTCLDSDYLHVFGSVKKAACKSD